MTDRVGLQSALVVLGLMLALGCSSSSDPGGSGAIFLATSGESEPSAGSQSSKDHPSGTSPGSTKSGASPSIDLAFVSAQIQSINEPLNQSEAYSLAATDIDLLREGGLLIDGDQELLGEFARR